MGLKQRCRGWWIALAAALADRLTKRLVAWLCPRGGALIPRILNLRPVENRGIAFSMLSGKGLVLALFTAALIAGLVAWLVTHPGDPALVGAAAMGLFIWIREKKNAVWIDSFSIAGSMLVAMTAAIFLGKLG